MIFKKVLESIFLLLVGIAAAYGLLCIYALTLGDALLFASRPAPVSASRDVIFAPSPQGRSISLLYLPSPGARFTLLYHHGHLEDLEFIRPRLEAFRRHGYHVLSYDYPGFGATPGPKSEAACHDAALAAYRYLVDVLRVPPAQIISYGRSMGSGPALQLAVSQPVAGVVLQSPFVSAFRVQTGIRLLPWDRFSNIDIISQLRVPLFLVHGLADETIPAWHSQMLAQAAPVPPRILTIPFALHNNVIEIAREDFWNALDEFAKSLPGS